MWVLYNDFFKNQQGLIRMSKSSFPFINFGKLEIRKEILSINMSSSHKTTHIGSLLAEVFRKKGWDRRLGLHEVFHFWNEVVGKDVAKRAQPYVIRGKVLWVHVSDSVWMQQLHLQKTILLDRINRRLKDEELSDMRFQLDAGLGQAEHEAARHGVSGGNASAEGKKFEKIASSLHDGEVKDAMKKLWIKSHKK